MRNIMTVHKYFSAALIGLAFFASIAECNDVHLESRLKRNNEFRAKLHWNLQEGKLFKKNQINLTVNGQGKFSPFDNAKKTIEASGQMKEGIFRIEESRVKLIDQNSSDFVEYTKKFDYDNKVVIYERRQGKKDFVLTKTFPIKGLICDDATMVYCVERILAKDDQTPFFYLVTNEPSMYKVLIYDRGIEQINNRVVRKFQLIGDIGKLTKIVIKFIPPTYVWYEKDFAHKWFQYEGMESGRKSANIVISPMDSEE